MEKKLKSLGIILFGLIFLGTPSLYAGDVESSPADVEYQMAVEDRTDDLEEVAANRDAVMDNIVATWSANASGWEEQFEINVSQADDSKLLALQNAESFDEVIEVLDENLGATSVYVPVTPCKIVDTRSGGGGFISAGSTRSYNTYGSLGSQGGSFCSSPLGEPTAVHIGVTAIQVTGKGNVKVKPYLSTVLAGHQVNYNVFGPGGTNLANTGTVAIRRNAAFDIYVVSQYAGLHVSIQVLGYYYQINENWFEVKNAGSQSSGTTNLTTGGPCTNYSNGRVSIFAPGPGKITVTAQAWLRLSSHNSSTVTDYMYVYLGTSSTQCLFSSSSEGYHAMPWAVAGPSWTSGFQYQEVSVSRTFTVPSAGTRTYYLNGDRFGGTGTMGFWYSAMQAVYYPNF